MTSIRDPADAIEREVILRAIDEVGEAVATRRNQRSRRAVEIAGTIEEMAAITARHAAGEADAIALEVERLATEHRISPVEPGDLTWSVFRSFGFGGSGTEIRWTKWIGSLLDPGGCGPLVSRFAAFPPLSTLTAAQRALLDPREAKRRFRCDAYPLNLSAMRTPGLLIDRVTYWHGLFSHRRDDTWKGLLAVALDADDDARALARLETP